MVLGLKNDDEELMSSEYCACNAKMTGECGMTVYSSKKYGIGGNNHKVDIRRKKC